MGRYRHITASLLFFMLGMLSVHAAQSPFQAFINYLEALSSAESPDELMPFLAKDKVERAGEISEDAALQELEVLRQTMTGIEFLYYTTQMRGARAELTIEGVDLALEVPVRWEIVMVQETDGWKFRTMQVSRDINPIDNQVRDWHIGKDKTSVSALLQAQKADRVILLLNDMRMWEVPVAELSDEDRDYLEERAETKADMLKLYRAQLLKKAKAAGILPRGKTSLL